MKRVQDLKEKVSELDQQLNTGYPRYRFDKETSSEISQKLTKLKDSTLQLSNQLKRQSAKGELSDFEKAFIEPAIHESYMNAIDKIRRGAKPSAQVHDYLLETLNTLGYWICSIEEYKCKKL